MQRIVWQEKFHGTALKPPTSKGVLQQIKKKLSLGIIAAIVLMFSSISLAACNHQWSLLVWLDHPTCTEPGRQVCTCDICGESDVLIVETIDCVFRPATCYLPEYCEMCFAERGEPAGHRFAPATCRTYERCIDCGLELVENGLASHNWSEATCLQPQTCSVCTATQGGLGSHLFMEATCLDPIKCLVCELTVGSTTDHNYLPATCQQPATCYWCGTTSGTTIDHVYDGTSVCGNPAICTMCGTSESVADGHTFDQPTCQKPATCIVCGDTTGSTIDHLFVDGRCVMCGRREAVINGVDDGEVNNE